MKVILFIIQLINGYIVVQSIALIKEDFKMDKVIAFLVSLFLFFYLSKFIFMEYLTEIILLDVVFVLTVLFKDISLHKWITSRWKLYLLFTVNFLLLFII